MSTDQLGIIDLAPGDWEGPRIPASQRGLMVTPSDLVGERPGGQVTAPQPQKATETEPDIKLPAGLTIRDGDRLRATVNDQDYAVSDVLPHLRAVEAVLMTASAAGRRVSIILKLEEAAS